jgi:hypothetical protein
LSLSNSGRYCGGLFPSIAFYQERQIAVLIGARNMKRFSTFHALSLLVLLMGVSAIAAFAQITPTADAYTNTASPGTNYGAKTLLDVDSSSQTAYIQFDLSSIPSGYTGSSVAKATLKLYVNAVTTAGSLNVDYVNGSWSESTITANMAPALGTTIVPSVALAKDQVKDYVLIDITPAVQAWLNDTQANDGIALVANSPLNANFDSKESTTQSHPPELDIVFAGGSGNGITGVLTPAGSGLTGGGTSGTLNLSLLTSCGTSQILAWNGSGWGCSSAGAGTITGVTAGVDLLGGGTGGNVTLNLDTSKVPQLVSNNVFLGSQAFLGNAGIGVSPSGNTYTPLSVGTSNSFGTWLALSNSSSSGHTWNIISAGGGNAEGAGNLGITDLTGKSTIWLEGNTNVSGALGVGIPAVNNVAIFGQGSGGTGSGSGEIGQANPNNGLSGTGIVGWGGGGTNGGAAGFVGYGGSGILSDGPGAAFHGGSGSRNGGGDGLDAYAGSGLAGFFSGSVDVTGSISKGGGSFKIDDPLDPANKYLYHSFVESPDMMNIYNGNVVTDGSGNAIIQLPDWFEALNRDFRYQLTVIGQFAQAIVTQKVSNHQFGIKTDKPEVEVSWQITGIRKDAWANAHRIPVEEEKDVKERGYYLHPELYGAPAERSVAWARHPETMKRIGELRKEGDAATAPAKRSSASSKPAAQHTR